MVLAAVARRMSLFKIIFSKIFEEVVRRLIGLYDAGFSRGLFGLKISITIECFQIFGKIDNLSIAL
jgi:hypothetical protein